MESKEDPSDEEKVRDTKTLTARRRHPSGSGKSKPREHDTSKVGDRVVVRYEEAADEGAVIATIIRIHTRRDEASVRFDEEEERIERFPWSQIRQLFEPNDQVQFRESKKQKGSVRWHDGIISARSPSLLTYDVRDAPANKIHREVPVRYIRKSEMDTSDQVSKRWKVGDNVSFRVEEADAESWQIGTILRIRKDRDHYDIAADDDQEKVSRRVPGNCIRIRKESVAERKVDPPNKIRSRTRRREESKESSSDETIQEKGLQVRSRRMKNNSSEFQSATWTPSALYIGQVVDFEVEQDGKLHRGRIQSLSRSKQLCDIVHDSDNDCVSERVPFKQVWPPSMFSKLLEDMGFGARSRSSSIPFQVNQAVWFAAPQERNRSRRGRVIHVERTSKKRRAGIISCRDYFYTVEDVADNKSYANLPHDKLRSVSLWTDPHRIAQRAWQNAAASLKRPPLRQGLNVRFQLQNPQSGRVEWHHGKILRVNVRDGNCVVQYQATSLKTQQPVVARATIENNDIEPISSITSAARAARTAWDSVTQNANPLTALSFFSTGPLITGTFVDVLHGESVRLATILAIENQNKDVDTPSASEYSYTIQYMDGKKEKHVPSGRLRASSRRLNVGTHVEMIVEGPRREVSKLKGEIAWVHRDEKAAVRVLESADGSDIFAQVSTRSLLVNGKPAFRASLTNTGWEIFSAYAHLALEMLIHVWFCLDMIVEIAELLDIYQETSHENLTDAFYMNKLYNAHKFPSSQWQTCTKRMSAIGNQSATFFLLPMEILATDRVWLLLIFILKATLTGFSALCVLRMANSKLKALRDNYIDWSEVRLDRVCHRWLALFTGSTLLVSYLSLIVAASLVNHFHFYCLDVFDSDARAIRLDWLAFAQPIFSIHGRYATVIEELRHCIGHTTLTLFRAVTLYWVAFGTTTLQFWKRILMCIPAIGVTAVLSGLGAASVHTFYAVQRGEMRRNKSTTLSSVVDAAILLVVIGMVLKVTLARLCLSVGRFFEDAVDRGGRNWNDISESVVEKAENGNFGMQAQEEAFELRVERKQQEIGIVRLCFLRFQRHCGLQLVCTVIGITSTIILKLKLSDWKGYDTEPLQVYTLGQHSSTIQLVFLIVWLCGTLISSSYAKRICRQIPELYSKVVYL
uniref:Uncharacterized protein AlNc14C80G5266 n=1 Tax=Albugo laibachii Nc14 TaxID=890382 RepID=F0WF72_9STRA|nr:conserved hypothetical protein [Albugo laibachii Nc14]|eukprot:CCA19854.1 conserved hypothetical protein [Albugo laibachii Nc14]